MQKIDLLSIIVGSQPLTAPDHPMFQIVEPQTPSGLFLIHYVKALTGWPEDGLVADERFIYQRTTEGDGAWSDPTKLKRYPGLGSPRMPRYLVLPDPSAPQVVPGLVYTPPASSGPGMWQFTLDPSQTVYEITDESTTPWTITKVSNGFVRNTILWPVPGAASNDLPAGMDLIAQFEHGGVQAADSSITYPSRETLFHRAILNADASIQKTFGRYKWTLEPWDAANKVWGPVSSSSVNDKLLSNVTVPKPVEKAFV